MVDTQSTLIAIAMMAGIVYLTRLSGYFVGLQLRHIKGVQPVLEALHKIQSAYPITDNPIRTALVTARSAPAHKRVVLTLREWGIRIDEALFLGERADRVGNDVLRLGELERCEGVL